MDDDDDFYSRLAVLAVFGTPEMAERAAYEALKLGTQVNYVRERGTDGYGRRQD